MPKKAAAAATTTNNKTAAAADQAVGSSSAASEARDKRLVKCDGLMKSLVKAMEESKFSQAVDLATQGITLSTNIDKGRLKEREQQQKQKKQQQQNKKQETRNETLDDDDDDDDDNDDDASNWGKTSSISALTKLFYEFRIECYFELGRLEKALKDSETALELSGILHEDYVAGPKGDDGIVQCMAKTRAALKQYEKGLEMTELFRRLWPEKAAEGRCPSVIDDSAKVCAGAIETKEKKTRTSFPIPAPTASPDVPKSHYGLWATDGNTTGLNLPLHGGSVGHASNSNNNSNTVPPSLLPGAAGGGGARRTTAPPPTGSAAVADGANTGKRDQQQQQNSGDNNNQNNNKNSYCWYKIFSQGAELMPIIDGEDSGDQAADDNQQLMMNQHQQPPPNRDRDIQYQLVRLAEISSASSSSSHNKDSSNSTTKSTTTREAEEEGVTNSHLVAAHRFLADSFLLMCLDDNKRDRRTIHVPGFLCYMCVAERNGLLPPWWSYALAEEQARLTLDPSHTRDTIKNYYRSTPYHSTNVLPALRWLADATFGTVKRPVVVLNYEELLFDLADAYTADIDIDLPPLATRCGVINLAKLSGANAAAAANAASTSTSSATSTAAAAGADGGAKDGNNKDKKKNNNGKDNNSKAATASATTPPSSAPPPAKTHTRRLVEGRLSELSSAFQQQGVDLSIVFDVLRPACEAFDYEYCRLRVSGPDNARRNGYKIARWIEVLVAYCVTIACQRRPDSRVVANSLAVAVHWRCAQHALMWYIASLKSSVMHVPLTNWIHLLTSYEAHDTEPLKCIPLYALTELPVWSPHDGYGGQSGLGLNGIVVDRERDDNNNNSKGMEITKKKDKTAIIPATAPPPPETDVEAMAMKLSRILRPLRTLYGDTEEDDDDEDGWNDGDEEDKRKEGEAASASSNNNFNISGGINMGSMPTIPLSSSSSGSGAAAAKSTSAINSAERAEGEAKIRNIMRHLCSRAADFGLYSGVFRYPCVWKAVGLPCPAFPSAAHTTHDAVH